MKRAFLAISIFAAFMASAWAQHEEPIVFYSVSESLEYFSPLEGAKVPAADIWFKVEPGTIWKSRGIRSIASWCCKEVHGDDKHGPKQVVDVPGPYIYKRDLTGYEEGSVREFYMDALFTDRTYESDITNFTIRKSVKLTALDCKLIWEPSSSEDNPNVDVVGYKVNLVTMDPYSVTVTDVGLVTEANCDVVKAKPGRNTASVEAYNQHGVSEDPETVSWIIVTEAPRPPSNVRHKDCVISWDPSPDEASLTVSGYLTTVSQNQNFSGAVNKDVGLAHSAECGEIGAKEGRNYVKVRSYNPAGSSEYTDPLEFIVGDGEVPPCPPCNLCEICKKECPSD